MKLIFFALVFSGMLSGLTNASPNDTEPQKNIQHDQESDELIGRWCYFGVPTNPKYDSLIEISKSDDGSIIVHIQHRDNSENTRELSKKNGDFYTNNQFGEFYRITQGGSLELHDETGLIGAAKSVNTDATASTCRTH